MARILASRLVQLGVTLLGIMTILFLMLRASGDPAQLLAGPDASSEQIAALRHAMGLDRPLWLQFLAELARLVTLDFGLSFRAGTPAFPLVLDRLAVSLELTGLALALAVVAALPTGVAAAAWPRSMASRALMALCLVGQALPIFWTGPLLILLFAVSWRLLPTSDWTSPAHMVLPSVALALALIAKLARVTRAQMIEALAQDFVRTARAKGLRPRIVLLRHGLRNALIPVVTVIGAELGALVGSAVLTETIFAIPGLGLAILQAALARDYPVVNAGVFLVAGTVVGLNTLVDLAYLWLDPRLRAPVRGRPE